MQQTSWSPRTAGIAASGAGGILMAIVVVTMVTDGPGQVIGGVAALGLLTFATMSWFARPKLAISDAGLVVRGWWQTRTLHRDEIVAVRITEFRRLARKVRLLEIDTTDDRLYVFTRWDLGTNPLDVLDALTDAGYAG